MSTIGPGNPFGLSAPPTGTPTNPYSSVEPPSNGGTAGGSGAAQSNLVWPSGSFSFLPFGLASIPKRDVFDAAMMGVAIMLGIVGIVLVTRQDFGKISAKLLASAKTAATVAA